MNTDHLTMSDIRICDNATQHNTTLPLSGPTLTHGSTILEEMRWGTDYFLRGLETLVAVLSVEPLAAFGTFDHRGLVAGRGQ